MGQKFLKFHKQTTKNLSITNQYRNTNSYRLLENNLKFPFTNLVHSEKCLSGFDVDVINAFTGMKRQKPLGAC